MSQVRDFLTALSRLFAITKPAYFSCLFHIGVEKMAVSNGSATILQLQYENIKK